MSANSDTRKVLDRATELGFQIVKAKHGGWAVMDGDAVVTRVRAGSNQPRFWVKSAMRALEKAAA